MKIVADSKIPYLKGLLELVAQEVLYVPGGEINNEVLRDAQVLLTRTRTRCNRNLLDGTDVEFIGTATIGTDHINLDYCRDNGITVVNAPGCNAPAVAQWVHASILQWIKARKIEGPLTIGVVGVGHVGSIVARWAQQLGYRVLLNDPPLAEKNNYFRHLSSPFFSLDYLQRECDIITFHTPLTRDGKYPTWHLCDEKFLNGLQRCCLIMNAARGAVCDNEALLHWHGDVALDCWEGEPNINQDLLDKAFIATPHIAGYSLQGKQRGTAMIIEALNRHYDWNINSIQASTPLCGAKIVTQQTILDSYNPLVDTARLKSSSAAFENQRNNYSLRNELP
jgi:erythronate-4-phosphate dehydrogenase